MSSVKAYAAQSATTLLDEYSITRRNTLADDVRINIEYCGVCHSDIHLARDEWGRSEYPMVPGHEIVGRVIEVGSNVTEFALGELVGVGVLVNSCGHCSSCQEQEQQYCKNGFTLTYNAKDPIDGSMTYGGYSKEIVVTKSFVLKVPENIDTKAVAPLLCAGITTYSPLKHWGVKAGDRIGVIGLGGLGHMGIKFAKALGATVVMITRSIDKGKDAKNLGADEVLLSTDNQAMEQNANSFDFLLNTIPVSHDMNPYIGLLKRDATMCIVGAIEPIEPGVNGGLIIRGRKSVAGSFIGGLKETQDMLDFCGKHNIVPEVEMININQINTAYERMINGDVRYRFVIDMKNF